MKSFRDLEIWQSAHKLRIEIYKITATYPKEEKYNLISQLRRSSGSVADQIAESHGRYYYADKVRILYQSRGECEEVRSQLSFSLDINYIDENYEILNKRISAYIQSLKKRKN